MKRVALVRHMTANGCHLLREGRSHAIWTNPATGAREAVPRHTEIKDGLARSICRKLGIPPPSG